MHSIQHTSNKFGKFFLLTIGAFLLISQFGTAQSHRLETSSKNGFEPQIDRTPSEITFTWQLDQKQLDQNEEKASVNFLLPGFIQTNNPEEYVLPEQSHLIALPQNADPSLKISISAVNEIQLNQPPSIAPIPSGVETNSEGVILSGSYESTAQASSSFPTSPVQLEEIGQMAGVRLARLTFSPIVFDHKSGQYQFVEALEVRLMYGGTFDSDLNRGSSKTLTGLKAMLVKQVVNPELLNFVDRESRQAESISPPQPNLILEIDTFGLFEITYEDLAAVDSTNTTINPNNWQLAKEGQPVDMHWIGDGDSQFEANERFLFYAAPDANRWSNSEFYTLTAGSTPGSRVNQAPANSAALPAGKLTVSNIFEQDANYTPNCFCGQLPLGRDGDRWIWDELRVPGNPTGSYPIDLPNADISAADSAELTLWMIGFTSLPKNDDHLLKLSINNTQLGDVIWDGKTAITQTVSIPAGVLTTSSELKLTLDDTANPIDGVWLDAFSISYIKSSTSGSPAESFLFKGESSAHQYSLNLGQAGWAFDVTLENQPQFISSGSTFALKDQADSEHTYLVTAEADIQQPLIRQTARFADQPANLLMIGPAEFKAGLAPLIQLRTSQGWSVDFIPLEEIYDSYGYGYPSPYAIHAALQDAYQSSTIQPEAVILVGDGTHDPKLNQSNGKETFVPVMFADVDPWIGEIPADNRYVTVDGDDVLPDMLLGRLPANNLTELATLVSKLTTYPTQNLSWRKNITFIADNNDSAGRFSEFATNQSVHLDSEKYQIDSVDFSGEEADLPEVKSQIEARFAAGNNHLIYIGHSTVHQWADESLMHINQVDELSNTNRLPIILQMTCFTGSFHMAGLDSFDEALIRHETGGAIGVWGATGLSVTTGHDSLADGYLEVLGAGGNPLVGEAILAGKIKMMTEKPRHADLIDTYTFFGDPTLILTDPGDGTDEAENIYLPLINKR